MKDLVTGEDENKKSVQDLQEIKPESGKQLTKEEEAYNKFIKDLKEKSKKLAEDNTAGIVDQKSFEDKKDEKDAKKNAENPFEKQLNESLKALEPAGKIVEDYNAEKSYKEMSKKLDDEYNNNHEVNEALDAVKEGTKDQEALQGDSRDTVKGIVKLKDLESENLKKQLDAAGNFSENKGLINDLRDMAIKHVGNEPLATLVDQKFDEKVAKVEKEYKAADVALGKRIDQLTLDTTKGLAKVAALGSLHAVDYSGNARFNFAVAAASYKSENAVAIGAFYHPNRNVVLSFGTALGDGDNVYSVGASFAFGKSGEPANVSTAELYDMIAALQQKVAELEARK